MRSDKNLGIGVGTTLGNHLFSTDYRVNVFRIGLNYKFGDDYLPALLAK